MAMRLHNPLAGEPAQRYPGFWTEFRPRLDAALNEGSATLDASGRHARIAGSPSTPAVTWTLPDEMAGSQLFARSSCSTTVP
ncbi:MAG: hypothetical protein CME06_12270 [Gemmatimonadetes bacterium]|nr:hypothetical protein [Gemmatimonadota bacterium]